MALITCSECGREISDKAEFCTNCGNPNREISKITVQPERIYIKAEEKSGCEIWTFVGILIAAILIIIIIGSL